MGTYHPIPSSYELFENVKSEKSHKNLLGKVDRFKLPKDGSGLGPGKYLQIQKWFGK